MESISGNRRKIVKVEEKEIAASLMTTTTTNTRKRKIDSRIPTDYDELWEKTNAGLIPDTIFYRATSNSMYIPSITADMINNNGTDVTINSGREYFKYNRVHQITKSDHADPEKVLEIIEAVRKRPIIWDQRLLCHQNLHLVRLAWQDLDTELGPDEAYTLTRRKQIWKSKKDYYANALNLDTLSKWVYTSAMEFYRPMIGFRTTVCLRPTVPNATSSSSSSDHTYEKLLLADKNITCSPDDKNTVLTFLLKSLFETGMSNYEMMGRHAQKILEIFENNLQKLKIDD